MDGETDEDDIYFTPTSSSNLASLFNTTMLPLQQGKDASLTYKPPKQPNFATDQNVKATVTKYESSIITFKEVHAFQIINKEYLPLGKCGFTLVGNEQLKIYQMLLYKNKDNIISSTKPTPSFEITIKTNNYISFTDDKNLSWALHFNTEDDLNNFTQSLVARCQCKLTKQIIKEDKNIEHIENTPEDSTKKEDIFHNCIEHENDEVLLKDKSTYVTCNSISKSEKTNVKNKVFGIQQDTNVSKNIDSDASDSSEATKKADIMNRVAKMGKKLFQSEPTEVNDSDIDDKITKPDLKFKQALEPSKQTEKPSNIAYPSNIPRTLVPYQETNKSLLLSPITADQFNMYFLENKHSASEIKYNILKLQNGVDEVLKIVKKNESDTRSMSTQTDHENLLDENKKLLLLISQQNDTLEKLKASNEHMRNTNEELVNKATENAYVIVNLVEKNAKMCTELQNIKEENEKSKHSLVPKSEDEIILNKSVLSGCEANIKLQMNAFFKETCEVYSDDQQYDGRVIKKYLAQTIIHNTYSILKTVKEMFNDN